MDRQVYRQVFISEIENLLKSARESKYVTRLLVEIDGKQKDINEVVFETADPEKETQNKLIIRVT